jgi:dephospho-CoA kinase
MHLTNKKVRVIGITGLIGAGKSSVSNILKEYDVEIIDADKISRSSLDVGTLAYQKTIKAFGEIILNEDKTINRSILREITSSDKEQMKILESIIHPYVKEETIRRINESKARYVVLDVPLLFESNMDKLCDLTIFIHCKDDVRLERLVKRATMPLKDAKKLNSQVMSMKDKIALADIVIDNSKDLDFTRNQIEKIMTKI